MPSTWSDLKFQLMAVGENSTTWGNVTNLNIGTAIQEAIAGSADVTFASGNELNAVVDRGGRVHQCSPRVEAKVRGALKRESGPWSVRSIEVL